MLFAADYPFLDILWTMLVLFVRGDLVLAPDPRVQ